MSPPTESTRFPAAGRARPFMDALVYRLPGIVPPEENSDPNVIKAVTGSPSSYTGSARIRRSYRRRSTTSKKLR